MGITKSSHLIALGAFDASIGSGGSASAVTLLSITTEPSAPFSKGSKYYNSTTKKIYTAIADNTWTDAKESDPSFGAYYIFNNKTYTWDGNTLELFELEDYQKSSFKTNDYTITSIENYPSSKALSDGLATKQDELTAGDNIFIGKYPSISSDTQALFHFDNNITNSITNSTISANSSSILEYGDGKFNSGTRINSINSGWQGVDFITSSQNLDFNSQDIHLEFWFKINDIRVGGNSDFITLCDNSGRENYQFSYLLFTKGETAYNLAVSNYSISGAYDFLYPIGTIPFTDNSFHLFTFEKTSTNIYIYLDGQLVATRENMTDSFVNANILMHMEGLDINIDEFLFAFGGELNHNGVSFTPNVLPYTTASGDALIINTITDSSVSSSSILPIQSKAVGTALETLNTTLTTNLTEGLATKQDTLTAGNNIDISIVPGIDSETKALFHFNDSLTNSITNSSIYADTSASYSYEPGKFNNGVRIVTPTSAYGGTYFINSNQNIEVGTQDFYFEFWFKINSLYTREISDYIVLLDNSDFGYLLFTNNGTSYTLAVSQYGISQATDLTYPVATIDYSDTNYHLFTMERTGTNAYIYIDGNLVATRVNATNSIGTISRIMYISGLDISIDEFIFELGSSKNHNGQNFTPYTQPYLDTPTQTVISAIVPTVSTVEVTSTTPSLTLADNTFYNCTNALTSLTISSIPANNVYGIEIHFTTDTGFSGVTFPSGTLYTGTLPTWEANKSYLISISRNVVVAAEIKTME